MIKNRSSTSLPKFAPSVAPSDFPPTNYNVYNVTVSTSSSLSRQALGDITNISNINTSSPVTPNIKQIQRHYTPTLKQNKLLITKYNSIKSSCSCY